MCYRGILHLSTNDPYSFGDEITKAQARFGLSLTEGSTSEVGTFPSNSWGLHDMHGNVWEWVSDWYRAYSATGVTDPQGPATGVQRMSRGGCWFNEAKYLRSAKRDADDPGIRAFSQGFRCAAIQGL